MLHQSIAEFFAQHQSLLTFAVQIVGFRLKNTSVCPLDRKETYYLFTHSKLTYGQTEMQMTMCALELKVYFGYIFICLKFSIKAPNITHITKNTQK